MKNLNTISVEGTVKSYSGRTGCMCGCRGKYSTTDKARKAAVTALLKRDNVKLHVWNDEAVEGVIYTESDTGYTRAVYLNADGVRQARACGL